MNLTNGVNRPVVFEEKAIEKEASINSSTSFVQAVCSNGDVVVICQHGQGDWDISINDDPIEEVFCEDEARAAVQRFMELCREREC